MSTNQYYCNVKDNEFITKEGHFFKAGKLGVAIVLRSSDQSKIDKCNLEILKFVKEKKIQIIERD